MKSIIIYTTLVILFLSLPGNILSKRASKGRMKSTSLPQIIKKDYLYPLALSFGEIFQVKEGLKNRKCSPDELMKAKTAIEEVYSEVAGKSAMFSQSDLYPPYFDYKDDSLLCESGYIKFAELELCLELYEDKVKDLEKIKKITSKSVNSNDIQKRISGFMKKLETAIEKTKTKIETAHEKGRPLSHYKPAIESAKKINEQVFVNVAKALNNCIQFDEFIKENFGAKGTFEELVKKGFHLMKDKQYMTYFGRLIKLLGNDHKSLGLILGDLILPSILKESKRRKL